MTFVSPEPNGPASWGFGIAIVQTSSVVELEEIAGDLHFVPSKTIRTLWLTGLGCLNQTITNSDKFGNGFNPKLQKDI